MDRFLYIVSTLGLLLGTVKIVKSVSESPQPAMLYRKNLKQMVAMIDEDVEPCDDFFQHACGYYEQTILFGGDGKYDSQSSESVPPMLYNNENRLRFFESHYEGFGTEPGKLLSKLYAECRHLQRSAVLEKPEKLWQYMVQEVPLLASDAGGSLRSWPYLHYQWMALKTQQGVELSWPKLAAELAAYGVEEVFLQIFFAQNTIYLAPPDQVMYCDNLTEIKDSLLPFLMGRSTQVAEIIGHELFLFCQELKHASADITNDNDDTDLLRDEVLNDYCQTFFRRLNFTESEVREARIIMVDTPQISAALRIFRNADARIVYNFLLWRAYQSLSATLDDCFLLADEFEELLLAEYWQWHAFRQHFQREVALAAYNFHTTRFQQTRKSVMASSNWSAFLEIQSECNDLDIAHIIAFYANERLAPGKVLTAYESLERTSGAFYANLLRMRCLRKRASFIQPFQDLDDLNHPHYYLRQFLNFSILLSEEPLFHYFATQGLDLWHSSRLLYSTDGYYTAVDCLQRQSSRWHLDYENNVANSSQQLSLMYRFLREDEVLFLFNFYRAFVATYRDYQFWLQGEAFAFAEDYLLKFFELDSSRIMFYAVTQQYCGRNDELYENLINRSYMSSPEFQVAFNCSAEAPMNPEIKCMINNCEAV